MTTEIILPSNDDRNIATITHLLGIFFCIVPALVVWLLKKDDSAYISDQAKEALNFQITLLIAYFLAWILVWILIGFALLLMLWLGNIVLCITAAISSSKGESYRYPFTLRLIH